MGKYENLSVGTINFILKEIKDIASTEVKSKIESIRNQVEKTKKVDSLEELYYYQNGKTIDYGSLPNDLKSWRNCLYDYEKGVDTSLENQLEEFTERLTEEEFNLVWDNNRKEYNFEELEKLLEEYYPGIVKFLVGSKITTIRFYW